jgi:hypothetical protein
MKTTQKYKNFDGNIKVVPSKLRDTYDIVNRNYLLNIIKDELGLTDTDIRYLTPEELKRKIRGNKLNGLL